MLSSFHIFVFNELLKQMLAINE